MKPKKGNFAAIFLHYTFMAQKKTNSNETTVPCCCLTWNTGVLLGATVEQKIIMFFQFFFLKKKEKNTYITIHCLFLWFILKSEKVKCFLQRLTYTEVEKALSTKDLPAAGSFLLNYSLNLFSNFKFSLNVNNLTSKLIIVV